MCKIKRKYSEQQEEEICSSAAAHLEVGENSSDVFLKAHVNHPVGLIQGQVAAYVQAHHLLLEEIHQSARGGYHHVDAAQVGREQKQNENKNQQRHFSSTIITIN